MARSVFRCAGCGAAPDPGDVYQWTCPNRWAGDDVDHVMARQLDLSGLPFVTSDSANPFVRYRSLLHAYHLWVEGGGDDQGFVALVDELDDAVARVEGVGFRRTPLSSFDDLDRAIGSRVWVKDETGNVTGSHKGRHLFGLSIVLAVVERLGLADDRGERGLAIASCGNAALAAAVIAAAAGRRLEVFVPPDAGPAVLGRLRELGATVTVSDRVGPATGDPCYHDFVAAVRAGAVPFGCQGPDNGLTIDGGRTLGWEIAEQLAAAGTVADRMVIQVGGGALASASMAGFNDAVDLGIVPTLPVFDCVQPEGGGMPLVRAYRSVVDRVAEGRDVEAVLAGAGSHRGGFMHAAQGVPVSVARGILDDETYDWMAALRGVVVSGGEVLAVDEATLVEANGLAATATGIDVDATGSAGLAGLLALARADRVPPGSEVVVVFSGARRHRRSTRSAGPAGSG